MNRWYDFTSTAFSLQSEESQKPYLFIVSLRHKREFYAEMRNSKKRAPAALFNSPIGRDANTPSSRVGNSSFFLVEY
jgi:hypothetical protein